MIFGEKGEKVSAKPKKSKFEPFDEIRRYRDESNVEWLNITFKRYDGEPSSITIKRADAFSPKEIRRRLNDAGISAHAATFDVAKLDAEVTKPTGVIATATGWHQNSFVLPSGDVVGEDDILVPADFRSSQVERSAGTLDDWKASVARISGRSRFARFAILHALAAPLFRWGGLQEGAIFHFWGPSSTGKTTVISAGCSVTGSDKLLMSWAATARALEERAAANNGIQFVLDDTDRLVNDRGKMLKKVIHELTSGRGRAYSRVVVGQLPELWYDLWGISSGSSSIEDQLRQANYARQDSDLARIIDIGVPTRELGGIWPVELPADERASRTEKLRKASREYYGSLFELWIRQVVESQDSLTDKVKASVDEFVADNCRDEDGLERRIAQKFGLVYAAGKLACEMELVPWPWKKIRGGIKRVYNDYLGAKSRLTSDDEVANARRAILKILRNKELTPRFADKKDVIIPSEAVGVVYTQNGKKYAALTIEMLRRVCGSSKNVIKALIALQIVIPDRSGKRTHQFKVDQNKSKRIRFVVINVGNLRKDIV